MAKDTAKVTVNVINQAQSTNTPPLGIAFVIGTTLKGEPDNPDTLISSVTQFEKIYGNDGGDFTLMAEQAIQGGSKLRVCKITGAGALEADSTVVATSGAVDLFSLKTKGQGAYYNTAGNFTASVLAPTNGDSASGYFNLLVQDIGGSIVELYENLLYEAAASGQTYLKTIVDTSRLVTPVYEDSTGATGAVATATLTFTGGADGATPLIADYTGSQPAKTGYYAFDEYDDGNMISPLYYDPSITTAVMYGVGQPYAALRKDLVYIDHLLNSVNTQSTVTTLLDTLGTSKYAMMLVGGIRVVDTVNGGLRDMLGTGMVLGAISTSQNLYGPWYSPTAYVRGVLPAAQGVVNNWGSPASEGERNAIANAGGNCIVTKKGTTMLWDAYTMDEGTSPEKFFSIIQLEIYMVDVLKPTLERFLGNPNIWGTWERIYYTVLPFLDSLLNEEALYAYKWDGDQFVTSLDDLQINDATEVGQGIYKVQLQIKAVVPMVDVTLNIILTENSVEFS